MAHWIAPLIVPTPEHWAEKDTKCGRPAGRTPEWDRSDSPNQIQAQATAGAMRSTDSTSTARMGRVKAVSDIHTLDAGF
jgi:hypothetical protein